MSIQQRGRENNCGMEIQRSNNSNKYSWLSSKFPELRSCALPEKLCLENCICNRKRGSIFCNNCKKSFMGRIGERCQIHPEVAYLMDARNCAFCGAAAKDLRMGDQM